MSCYEVLKDAGYNLAGYSPDTIVTLQEEEGNLEECEALLVWLEVQYG